MTEEKYLENTTISDVLQADEGVPSDSTVASHELMPHLPDDISKGVVNSWATGTVEPDAETFEMVREAIKKVNSMNRFYLDDPSDLKYVLGFVGTHDSGEDESETTPETSNVNSDLSDNPDDVIL